MNIIEYARNQAIKDLFRMATFRNSFPTWKPAIKHAIGTAPSFHSILDLGDSLSDIFETTGVSGRGQSSVSGAGYAWEGILCWYMNLCLIDSRSVVLKQKAGQVPACIADALTVNYGTTEANTESDLVMVTFPNEPEFTQDTSMIAGFDYVKDMDKFCKQHIKQVKVGIIQCKTNWNDNAQIPMLWEIVYSSTGFRNKNITIGKNGVAIQNFSSFFYAFATVPSNDPAGYESNHLTVKRVNGLSGGNYWGRPSRSGVASSIKEIFNRKLVSADWVHGNHQSDMQAALRNWPSGFAYFGL